MSNSVKGNEDVKFSELFAKYLPFWPVFILAIVLSLGLAMSYLYFTPSRYEAVATLLIKDEQKGVNNSKLLQSLDLLNSNKTIENEIEVLKSRELMLQVIDDLNLYAQIYKKSGLRRLPIYNQSPISIKAKNPKELLVSNNISFVIKDKQEKVVLEGNKEYPFNTWVETSYGKLKFSRVKRNRSDAGAEYYFSLKPLRQVALESLEQLSVGSTSKLAGTINLRYRDVVPERAEAVLDELIKTYNKSVIDDKRELAVNTLAFLEDRLREVGYQIDSIQRNIQSYKASNNVVDISAQGKLYMEGLSANNEQLSEIEVKLAVLNQVETYVLKKSAAGSIVPGTLGINDPVLSDLLQKLYNMELQYEDLKSKLPERNPMMVSIADQIQKIKPSILENIRNQRDNLVASRKNLRSNIGSFSSQLQSIPLKERQLLNISRDQSIMNGIYSFLLQKREENAIARVTTGSDMKVVDWAQSSIEPVSPNRKLIYLLAILLAVSIVSIVIGIYENFNGKVLFRDEIEKATSLPIIGEIPYQKVDKKIVVAENSKTWIVSEFRKVRVTLPHIGIGESKKKILITSNIPGEGKSFFAANLAQTLAITQKKVVLVEMDLINPSLGSLMPTPPANGFSEYLNETANIDDIIKPTTYSEYLYYIPSGKIPDNPSELIARARVKELIDILEKIFDYVIIDSAPIMPISDAFILSRYCDATIFVIRHKYTPKALVKRLDETLKVNPLKNAAVVFNGIHSRGFIKHNNGYGYATNYVDGYKSK